MVTETPGPVAISHGESGPSDLSVLQSLGCPEATCSPIQQFPSGVLTETCRSRRGACRRLRVSASRGVG